MKKLAILLVVAVALSGCASAGKLERPQSRVVPTHDNVPHTKTAKPVIQTSVSVEPAKPTFRSRWDALKAKARGIPVFHHKKPTT